MTHLGDFGNTPAEVEDVTFGYFGQKLHANPELTDLDYIDFLEIAGGLDVDNVESLRVIKDFARLCVREDDFDAFWSTARKNRQQAQDIFPVLQAIVETIADRPTGQPSDSSDGQQSTAGKSEDVSSSRALQLVPADRDDLHYFIKRTQEAKAG